MRLDREQIMRRRYEFPQILIDLSHNNGVVHRMIDAYVYGAIVTKEEVYCQAILELAKTRDELTQRMVDEAHIRASMSFVLPINERPK
jgi:hypothetical protein